MISLQLGVDGTAPTILCLGAHADDLEIGACATLMGLFKRYPAAKVVWVVLAANTLRAEEARASAAHCLRDIEEPVVEIQEFRDGFFPDQFADIKNYFETLKSRFAPDVVFTHCRHDLHQDHRTVAELSWQTFRNHLILEYEIPKYEGDLGSPNLYCPVSEELRAAKLEIIDRFFASQRQRAWFTGETFSALMRIRGIECNAPSGFAEAFYARKVVLD